MQIQVIENSIIDVRGHKVMLDVHLAELYKVETRILKQAVKRNKQRFPADFMFQLTRTEFNVLRSQIVISKQRGGTQYLPYAFTEQGVAMLSSVLKSSRAVKINIAIVRTFVLMRQYALSHKDLTIQLREFERKYDKQFKDVHDILRHLWKKHKQEVDQKERKQIGFRR